MLVYLLFAFIYFVLGSCYDNNAQTEENFKKSALKFQERIQSHYNKNVFMVQKLTIKGNPEIANTTLLLIDKWSVTLDGEPDSFADYINLPAGSSCSFSASESYSYTEYSSWGISGGAYGSKSINVPDSGVFKSGGINVDANYQSGKSTSTTYSLSYSKSLSGPLNGSLQCQKYVVKGRGRLAQRNIEYTVGKTMHCNLDAWNRLVKNNENCMKKHKEMSSYARYKFCSNEFVTDQFLCLKKEYRDFKKKDFKEVKYEEVATDKNGKTFSYCSFVALDKKKLLKRDSSGNDKKISGDCPK
jgi:hypothetical protein